MVAISSHTGHGSSSKVGSLFRSSEAYVTPVTDGVRGSSGASSEGGTGFLLGLYLLSVFVA